MRMHRGSSKGVGTRPPPEILPLSASVSSVRVAVAVGRAGRSATHDVDVPRGTTVAEVLRQLGHPPEGSVALIDGVPCPLDRSIDRPTAITVLPTFSGG